jgi:hypothetical protein
MVTKKIFNKKWKEFKISPIGIIKQFKILNPSLLSDKSFDDNGNKIDFNQKKEHRVHMQKNNLTRALLI